jgi:hypothetical protein
MVTGFGLQFGPSSGSSRSHWYIKVHSKHLTRMQGKDSIKNKSPKDMLKITVLVQNSFEKVINTNSKQIKKYIYNVLRQLCTFLMSTFRR